MLDFLVVGINHVVLGLARRSRTRLLSALLRSLGLLLSLLLGGSLIELLADLLSSSHQSFHALVNGFLVFALDLRA